MPVPSSVESLIFCFHSLPVNPPLSPLPFPEKIIREGNVDHYFHRVHKAFIKIMIWIRDIVSHERRVVSRLNRLRITVLIFNQRSMYYLRSIAPDRTNSLNPFDERASAKRDENFACAVYRASFFSQERDRASAVITRDETGFPWDPSGWIIKEGTLTRKTFLTGRTDKNVLFFATTMIYVVRLHVSRASKYIYFIHRYFLPRATLRVRVCAQYKDDINGESRVIKALTRHCVPAEARIGNFLFIYHYYYYHHHPIKVESLKLAILLSGYFRNVPYNRCGRPTTPGKVAWPEHAALCSIISRSLFQRGQRRRREAYKACARRAGSN